MVVHDGSIFVVGHRNAVRSPEAEVVPLESMTEIRASETEHFVLPASFDVASYVHGVFGVAKPSKVRALVDFDARVADDVRAKRFHKDQRLAMSSDGRVRLSVPLVDVDAFVAWVLSFGDAARVVEPPDVVERVRDVLERAAGRYR